MFDYFTGRIPKWLQQIAIGSTLGILVYSFKQFNPLAYGFADASTERNSTMFGLRWLESWEFWTVIKSDDLLNEAEILSLGCIMSY